MILFIENPKFSLQNLSDIVNEFRKCKGYKINIQKYTNNELSEIESKIILKITSKRIKYQRITVTRELKDLCML